MQNNFSSCYKLLNMSRMHGCPGILCPKEELGQSKAKRRTEKLKVLSQKFINGMAVDKENMDPNKLMPRDGQLVLQIHGGGMKRCSFDTL